MNQASRDAVTNCLGRVRHIQTLLDQSQARRIFSENEKRRAKDKLSDSETALQIFESEISEDTENQDPFDDLARHLRAVLDDLKCVQDILEACIGNNPPPPDDL